MTGPDPILSIRDLTVRLGNGASIVEDIELTLRPGEILGLIGESGSGKTTTALSILGYAGSGAEISSADVRLDDDRLDTVEALRRVRGNRITYVPQNPGTALNPSLHVADAIADMVRTHRASADPADDRVQTLLTTVGLPAGEDGEGFGQRYPHQLSGGQQQRVCVAIALAPQPAVVILDEPTTGLDVVTQARILDELARLRDEQGLSMVYVTHDLAVVSRLADRVAVMYAGQIVEQGATAEILRRPRHPYTRGLISSTPDHVRPRTLEPMAGVAAGVEDRVAGACLFAPRCPQRVDTCTASMPPLAEVEEARLVRCFEWARTEPPAFVELSPRRREPTSPDDPPLLEVEDMQVDYRVRGGRVTVVSGVGFTVGRGSCVALVGESGSGKSTIARAVAGVQPIARGRIGLDGETIEVLARRRTREQRRRIQIVFQNPADALNPRHTVADAVARPAQLLCGLGRREATAEVAGLLDRVRLPARIAGRYPAELSGGERQRVAIARALAAGPELIVCDEVTSALDVSVQAAVLGVLEDLRDDGVSLLFITHDLGVVASIADDVLVLERGSICERGPVRDLLFNPQHPYTKSLLAAAPSITAATQATG